MSTRKRRKISSKSRKSISLVFKRIEAQELVKKELQDERRIIYPTEFAHTPNYTQVRHGGKLLTIAN